MDNIKEKMKQRWNKKGWNYDQADAHGIHNQKEKGQWLEIFKTIKDRPQKALDVGTGTGFLSLLLAEADFEVTAIDWSSTMLSQAQKKAEKKHLKIDFIESQTETLPFPDESFQLITARHLLWTLSKPEEALAEWYRVLKKEGVALADYSPKISKHNQHYSQEIEEKLPLNSNVNIDILKGLFENAGFKQVVIKTLKESSDHNQATFLIQAHK